MDFQSGILYVIIIILIVGIGMMAKNKLDKIAKMMREILDEIAIIRRMSNNLKGDIFSKPNVDLFKASKYEDDFNKRQDDFEDILETLKMHFQDILKQLNENYSTRKLSSTSHKSISKIDIQPIRKTVAEIEKKKEINSQSILKLYNETVRSQDSEQRNAFLQNASWLEYINSVQIVSEKNPITPIFKISTKPGFFFMYGSSNQAHALLFITFNAVLDQRERDLIASCFSICNAADNKNYLSITRPALIKKSENSDWVLEAKGEVCLLPLH